MTTITRLRRCGLIALVAGVLVSTGCQQDTSSGPSSSPSVTPASAPAGGHFDLQAHRGGRGETTEESRRAFEKALALGVSTLELDIVLSKDRIPVVWHDPVVLATKCSDTRPATAGDPQFPYVGKRVHELTWAQLQTLDCSKKLADFPRAEAVKGNRMLQLKDVFALARARGADVHFNVETKVEALQRSASATPQEFVDAILAVVREAGVADKVMIQSFDWRTLPLVHAAEPAIPLVMLWDETTWLDGSPWIGDVDFRAVGGDPVKAAQQLHASVLSPGYATPYGSTAGEEGFFLIADKKLCERAHQAGLTVVPWTINDPATMQAQIEAGADGIITDHPTLLRSVLARRGMALPTPYPAR